MFDESEGEGQGRRSKKSINMIVVLIGIVHEKDGGSLVILVSILQDNYVDS